MAFHFSPQATIFRPSYVVPGQVDQKPHVNHSMQNPLKPTINPSALEAFLCTISSEPSPLAQPLANQNDVTTQTGPTTSSATHSFPQDFIDKLQQTNTSQANEIVELRIKVAVLEKELETSVRESDAAVNSMNFVLLTLLQGRDRQSEDRPVLGNGAGQGVEQSPRIIQPESSQELKGLDIRLKYLESEVVRLRQENKLLEASANAKDYISACDEPLVGVLMNEITESKMPKRFPSVIRTSTLNDGMTTPPPLSNDSTKLSRSSLEEGDVPSVIESSSSVQRCSLPIQDEMGVFEDQFADIDAHRSHPSPRSMNTKKAERSKQSALNMDLGFKPIEQLFADSDDEEEVWRKRTEERQFVDPPVPEIKRVGFDTMGIFGGIESATEVPWTNAANKIWTSDAERSASIAMHRINCGNDLIAERRFPDLFRHGVQYQPSEDDRNYLRTITISNLPRGIELSQVLHKIRGGDVLIATLCDTYAILGSMSARVVFKSEYAACAYVNFCRQHPISFSTSTEPAFQTAIIELVQTPTYPNHHGRVYQQTRRLFVEDFPLHISIKQLKIDLAGPIGEKANQLLNLDLDDQQNLVLEFSSVNSAGSAFGILTKYDRYRLQPRFIPDPCGGPLEELLVFSVVDIPKTFEVPATFQNPATSEAPTTYEVSAETSSKTYSSLYDDSNTTPCVQQKSSFQSRQDIVNAFVNEHPRYASLQGTSTSMHTASRKIRDYNWTEEQVETKLSTHTSENKSQFMTSQSQLQSQSDVPATAETLKPAFEETWSSFNVGYESPNVNGQQPQSSNWPLLPLDFPEVKVVANDENTRVWGSQGRGGSKFATQGEWESSREGFAALTLSSNQNDHEDLHTSISIPGGRDAEAGVLPQEVVEPQDTLMSLKCSSPTCAVIPGQERSALLNAQEKEPIKVPEVATDWNHAIWPLPQEVNNSDRVKNNLVMANGSTPLPMTGWGQEESSRKRPTEKDEENIEWNSGTQNTTGTTGPCQKGFSNDMSDEVDEKMKEANYKQVNVFLESRAL